MTKRARGSEWRVVMRCYALLRRLMRAPASKHELLEIIRVHDGEPDDMSFEILESRLEGDLNHLRHSLSCTVEYVHAEKLYYLRELAHPLIDLSDAAVDGIAFLQQTFSSSSIPQREAVLRLLDGIIPLLPDDRQQAIARARSGMEVSLHARDSQMIGPDLIEKLTYACNAHREIEFRYRSPRQADGQARTHRVEPIRCYLDPIHHHYMLDAFYLEVNGPMGRILHTGYRSYRLERMSEVRLLAKHFSPRTDRRDGVELVYVLSANLARLRDVTGILENSVVTYEPDGSAIVRAISHNLFMDLKQLLRYGAECQVIGGEDAVRDMRALVRDLARVYGEE